MSTFDVLMALNWGHSSDEEGASSAAKVEEGTWHAADEEDVLEAWDRSCERIAKKEKEDEEKARIWAGLSEEEKKERLRMEEWKKEVRADMKAAAAEEDRRRRQREDRERQETRAREAKVMKAAAARFGKRMDEKREWEESKRKREEENTKDGLNRLVERQKQMVGDEGYLGEIEFWVGCKAEGTTAQVQARVVVLVGRVLEKAEGFGHIWVLHREHGGGGEAVEGMGR